MYSTLFLIYCFNYQRGISLWIKSLIILQMWRAQNLLRGHSRPLGLILAIRLQRRLQLELKM